MSLEQLASQAPEHTRADNPAEKLAKMQKILVLLTKRPCTTLELAAAIKSSKTLTLQYLKEMRSMQLIQPVQKSFYWQRVNHVYNFDYNSLDIADIPKVMFREIPIIKPWFTYSVGNRKKMQYVSTFEAMCYGEVADNFKINPMHWKHPETTELFYQKFKEQYGKDYPDHVTKALKAFLGYCLRVSFNTYDKSLEFFGLKSKPAEGKYRYVKLTTEEITQVIRWLDSDRGKDAAAKAGLEYDRLKGHFAYSFEGFPRPSRCLTIETDRVQKFQGSDDNMILHWQQPETKQAKEYSKFMLDNTLVSWAVGWLEKRRQLNYRYLFQDDNDYVIRKDDTLELAPTREPYTRAYKLLFSDLGKSGYFMTDTLYSLRHCGVHLWLERSGYNYDLVAEMGWENVNNLRKFYGGMSSSSILQFILKGNFTINQKS